MTQLIYDTCAADGDTVVAVMADELKHEWQTPGFDLDQDAFLVETGDARIVGYEEFFNEYEEVENTTFWDDLSIQNKELILSIFLNKS